MIEIARKSVPRNSLIRVAGKYVTWDQKCKDSCAKLVVNRVAGKIVTLDRNCKEICAKDFIGQSCRKNCHIGQK